MKDLRNIIAIAGIVIIFVMAFGIRFQMDKVKKLEEFSANLSAELRYQKIRPCSLVDESGNVLQLNCRDLNICEE